MNYYSQDYLYGTLCFVGEKDANSFFKNNEYTNTYQEYINDILKTYYRPNTNILDVGANVGIFSLSFAKIASNCQIHSFEPVKITNNLLNETIKINNINNVKIYNYGLGDKNEELNINVNPNKLGFSSIKQDLKKETEKIIIKKLDDINIQNISFIKVDIQEYEYEFLLGAENTLKNNNIILILEIPRRNNYEKNIYNKCINFLKNLNYIKLKNLGNKDCLFVKNKN